MENPVLAAKILNRDLQTIHEWLQTWVVKFNASKAKSLTFNTVNIQQRHHSNLHLLITVKKLWK